MRTEQIRIRTASIHHIRRFFHTGTQQVDQQFISMVAIMQTCPEIDLPGHRPTGTLITSCFECLTGSFRQFGGMLHRDFISRIKSIQVGNMTMMRFDFFIGFKPFQDTAILTDRGWHQTGTLIRQFLTKSRINSEDIGCRNRIGKQLTDNLIIHSRTGTDMYSFAVRHTVSIFRRSGRSRYQIIISRVTNQHIRKK